MSHETPPFASFGAGSTIDEPFTVTCPECISIGANVVIKRGAWLSAVDQWYDRSYEPQLIISDGCVLGPDIVIACIGRVEIGERVLTASRVFIGDTYHDYRDPRTAIIEQPMLDPEPVKIGAGAFLGIGCVVLPGVTIGERAYIAANTVVGSDVPANCVVAGNPGQVVNRWDPTAERWERPTRGSTMRDPEALSSMGADDRQLAELSRRLALTEAELRAANVEVEVLRERNDRLLATLAEANAARRDVERWLNDHRSSLTWRTTEPLRVARRKLRAHAARQTP